MVYFPILIHENALLVLSGPPVITARHVALVGEGFVAAGVRVPVEELPVAGGALAVGCRVRVVEGSVDLTVGG